MAKKSANVVVSAPVAPVAKSIDLITALGFCIVVDPDLSIRPNEKPSKVRLEHATGTMFARYEDRIRAILVAEFGDRISFIEAAHTYTGDPKTGIMREPYVESAIPGTVVPPVVVAVSAQPLPTKTPKAKSEPAPIVGEAIVEYEQLSVTELRGLCKDRDLKTAGAKAQLVKRLIADDSAE